MHRPQVDGHQPAAPAIDVERDLVAPHARAAELVVAADRDAPIVARDHIVDVAQSFGASPELLGRVRLAVSEAVSNAVRHAYRDGDRLAPEIRVSAGVDEGALHVVVVDRGVGLRAPDAQPGMGLGLAIMDAVADEVEVRTRSGWGTELHLLFSLAPEEPEG